MEPVDAHRHLPGGIPADVSLNGQHAGAVLRRTLDHLHELDAADLTVAGGDTVAIVCVAEVRDWLLGLATRLEAGERL